MNYFVDTKNVAEINNRFNNTSLSLKEQTATINYNELEWINEAAVKPTEKNTKKGLQHTKKYDNMFKLL